MINLLILFIIVMRLAIIILLHHHLYLNFSYLILLSWIMIYYILHLLIGSTALLLEFSYSRCSFCLLGFGNMRSFLNSIYLLYMYILYMYYIYNLKYLKYVYDNYIYQNAVFFYTFLAICWLNWAQVSYLYFGPTILFTIVWI